MSSTDIRRVPVGGCHGEDQQAPNSAEFFNNLHHSRIEQVNISNIQESRRMVVYLNPQAGLSSLDPIPDASHTRKRREAPPNSACFPGTRVDAIREILAWAKSRLYPDLPLHPFSPPHSAEHIMWVFGYAGCGKSAIAQAVAEHLAEEGLLAASFFFFRNSGDRSTFSKVAQTIAAQIVASIGGTAQYIEAALNAHPTLLQPTTSAITQFKHLVYDPIKAVVGAWSEARMPVSFVIDGFDECNDKDEACHWIRDLFLLFEQNPHIPLRFIIMSRVEDSLYSRLHSASQVRLLDLVSRTTDRDIAAVLDAIIADKSGGRANNAQLTPKAKQDIVQHAGGSFIFLIAVTEFLFAPSKTDGLSPSQRLDRALTMSPGFDSLYKEILAITKAFKHSPAIIQTIGLMLEPLSVVQIADLLDIDAPSVVLVLLELHAIIRLPGDDHTPIKVWHRSLIDFLNDQSRSEEYFASLDHHHRIASRCIELAMPLKSSLDHAASSYAKKYIWDHCKVFCSANTARVDGPPGSGVVEELLGRMEKKEAMLAEAPDEIMNAVYTSHLARSQQTQQFQDVIDTLTLAMGPISANQIADLLEIDPSHIAKVMTGLGSLFQPEIQVGGAYDEPLVPTYDSLNEFLGSETRSGPFFVSLHGHERLAFRCIDLVVSLSPSAARSYADQYVWDHYHAALHARMVEAEKRSIHIQALHRLRDKGAFLALAGEDIRDSLYRSILLDLSDDQLRLALAVIVIEIPLVSEIATLMGVKIADITDVVDALHGLVNTPPSSRDPYTLSHESLRKFVKANYPQIVCEILALPSPIASPIVENSYAGSADSERHATSGLPSGTHSYNPTKSSPVQFLPPTFPLRSRVEAMSSNYGSFDPFERSPPPDLTRCVSFHGMRVDVEGGFSSIYIGSLNFQSSGEKVAIKVQRSTSADPQYIATLQRRLRQESATWYSFSHENIIPLYGLMQSLMFPGGVSGLVYPWCGNGTVLEFLKYHPDTQRIPLIRGVASGLQYIHSLGAVHGNINSDHVLMSYDEPPRPLITGFRCAKFPGVGGYDMELESSINYLSPELMDVVGVPQVDQHGRKKSGSPTTHQSDVWAFGLVGAEILGGTEVFRRVRPSQLPSYIAKGGRPKRTDFPNISSDADIAWPVLKLCWNKDPTVRPTMEYILAALS